MLVPTRELAAQVALEARRLLFGTGRTVALLHGGQSVKPQLEQLAFAPMVVVSTPGRLLTCAADEGYVSLEEVKTLILDEADQMVDMGFAPQVAEICRGEACGVPPRLSCLRTRRSPEARARLSRRSPDASVQRHLPPAVRRLALDIAVGGPTIGRAAARARLGRPRREHRRRNRAEPGALREQPAGEKSSPCSWRRFARMAAAEKKGETEIAAVKKRRGGDDRVLVFCAGKSTAKWVRAELTKLLDADTLMARARGVPVPRTFAAEELHGDCSQGARSRAPTPLASGACRVLVATDVASRGLDLPAVTAVINFDLPTDGRDFDAYVHRIGRHRPRRPQRARALPVPPGVQQIRGQRPDLSAAPGADARDGAGRARLVARSPDASGNPRAFGDRGGRSSRHRRESGGVVRGRAHGGGRTGGGPRRGRRAF